MPAQCLEHFLIRTPRFAATKQFYIDVLNMREGWRPEFPFPGAWLYLGETPCVHLVDTGESQARGDYLAEGERQPGAARGTGAIDHLGFVATDLDGYIERLNRFGIRYRRRQVGNMVQLFLVDPNEIVIELNFRVDRIDSVLGDRD